MKTDRAVLQKLTDFIHDRLGVYYSAIKKTQLELKLHKIQQTTPYRNLELFYQDLIAEKPEALEILTRSITVNHTFFFREDAHFSALSREILARKLDCPMIWCAASSTGEEPYSIAITLLEQGIEDFLILSSDINSKVLHVMDRGLYDERSMGGVSRFLLMKYFKSAGPGKFQILPELRRYLRIKHLNLVEPIQFQAPFDFVFCRNVLIYFDPPTRARVIQNIVANLASNGELFLGHTEPLLEPPAGIVKVAHSVYRKIA